MGGLFLSPWPLTDTRDGLEVLRPPDLKAVDSIRNAVKLEDAVGILKRAQYHQFGLRLKLSSVLGCGLDKGLTSGVRHSRNANPLPGLSCTDIIGRLSGVHLPVASM